MYFGLAPKSPVHLRHPFPPGSQRVNREYLPVPPARHQSISFSPCVSQGFRERPPALAATWLSLRHRSSSRHLFESRSAPCRSYPPPRSPSKPLQQESRSSHQRLSTSLSMSLLL